MNREGAFQLFGAVHLWTMASILLVAAFCVFMVRKREWQHWVKCLSWSLAIVMVGNESIFIGLAMIQGVWSYEWGLPFQICDLAILAVAYSLIKHQQVIWELAYFWGLGGTLQAILTPDLTVTFPDYIYIKFFLTHGCILIGVIYLSAGLRRPIDFGSVKRVWLITNLYALIIGIFNWLFGTNYLYLCAKPSQASILDYLGPWPFYILGLEGVLTLSLLLYYLPYYFFKKLTSHP